VVHDCDLFCFPGVLAPVLSLEMLAPRDIEDGASPFELIDPGPLADDFLARMQVIRAVTGFVALLTPREQEIVRQIFWEDRSQTEVAAFFKVSKMAISKTMARIREKGRLALSPEFGSVLC
jgi:DNA-directed RNA polymerase specialized sigma24 family protein